MKKSMRLFAQRVAEHVFSKNYYDGLWSVAWRGHSKACSNYTTAKAWAKYIQRNYPLSNVNISKS